ncbi:MAG: hypothetical protein JJU18_03520 [Oceanicaulis sp.]|nr:hypothetical protein [Oceanicaulis sp.]
MAQALDILKNVCERLGYEFSLVDEYGYLARVSSGGEFFLAGAAKTPIYPLNSASAAGVCKDKAFGYLLLRGANFKIPDGDYFFIGGAALRDYQIKKGIDSALKYIEGLGYPVFIKPNQASHGRGGEVVYDSGQFVSAAILMRDIDYIIIVQELIDSPEYRMFIVDGEIKFIYRREKLFIEGDGNRSIMELIAAKSESSIVDARQRVNSIVRGAHHIMRYDDLSRVPKSREKIFVSEVANLAAGGALSNLRLEFTDLEKSWAQKISDTFGLRVCGVDYFAKSEGDPRDNIVIEVNSNPGLGGLWNAGEKDLVFSIWGSILDKYFN